MITTLERTALRAYVKNQLALFGGAPEDELERVLEVALGRFEHCLAAINLPGYSRDGQPYFNHLHGDQWTSFLYFCANSAWKFRENAGLAAQFYLLNRALNAIVIMYDTALPEIFLLNHAVGTVLGKATYANYFVAYHNVTIGSDDGVPPTIGERNVLYAGAAILGKSRTGSNVTVAANSTILNRTIPNDTIAIGSASAFETFERKRDFAAHYFKLNAASVASSPASKSTHGS